MRPATISRDALASIRAERVDWRFKGMPQSLAGVPIGEAAARRLNVFRYYAVWQHEKTWYHHAHGRAKFVSGPLVAASARLRIALAKAAQRMF